MKKFVLIDPVKCEQIGICESILPEVFEVQDDGSVRVNNDFSYDSRADKLLLDAISSCPKQAISLSDAD